MRKRYRIWVVAWFVAAAVCFVLSAFVDGEALRLVLLVPGPAAATVALCGTSGTPTGTRSQRSRLPHVVSMVLPSSGSGRGGLAGLWA
ncbi:hypothetical protein SAMN05421810_101705 [Amycolatopsis arida]|uniref:Uncharacterized protein n=1 Tax=Amycolatopsis arida TaxID=587909 RepID=A0A1I5LYD8_9PSEU|nr:hypothetical protein CLV69_104338 [Amycolatopsis arida]SFP01781.1 hypothetical protein SAMN05421810_101705 [Amycolatopsis arida]